jgi:predicted flap endonuclease-1-like 5' DNA nuclease
MPSMDLRQNYRFGGKLYRAGRSVDIPAALYAALNPDATTAEDSPARDGSGKAESDSAMPYADLLIPRHFADEDAVDAASDADLIAIDGIGPKRLAEIREYFGQ